MCALAEPRALHARKEVRAEDVRSVGATTPRHFYLGMLAGLHDQ